MTTRAMIVSAVLAACMAPGTFAAAGADAVPPEVRAAWVKGLKSKADALAKLREEQSESLGSRAKTLRAGKADPNPTADSPEMTVKGNANMPKVIAARKKRAGDLEQQLKTLTALPQVGPGNFVPNVEPGKEGREFGTLESGRAQVLKVLGGYTAVLTIKTTTGPMNVLLEGVDTSKMADGAVGDFPGVYYHCGNQQIAGRTVYKLIPVVFIETEKAVIDDKTDADLFKVVEGITNPGGRGRFGAPGFSREAPPTLGR